MQTRINLVAVLVAASSLASFLAKAHWSGFWGGN